jgi:hypothetical protein
LEGSDGKHKECIGPGGPGLASELHRLGGVAGSEPSDNGDFPSHLGDDRLQDPNSFGR